MVFPLTFEKQKLFIARLGANRSIILLDPNPAQSQVFVDEIISRYSKIIIFYKIRARLPRDIVVIILIVVVCARGLNFGGNILKIIISYCLFFTALFTPSYADDSNKPTKPSDIPVEAFARLNDGGQMEMSPDAASIAYIVSHKGRKHILVQKLDGTKRVLLPPIKEADIKWFTWKGNDLLLISYRFTVNDMGRTYASTRLVTYNLESNKMDILIKPKRSGMYSRERIGNIGDSIIDLLPQDPDHILLELDDDYDGDTSIFKVNIRTRGRSEYFSSKFGVTNWSVDEQKNVRWGTGYHLNERRVIDSIHNSG